MIQPFPNRLSAYKTYPLAKPNKGLSSPSSQGSALRSDPFLRYRYGVDKPLTIHPA
jgi:hypothetical protein